MHEREDRRTGSTRPSLLSTEQPAESEQSSILGNLDSKSGKKTKPKQPASAGKARWAIGAVALAALGAGAAVWSGYDVGDPPAVVAAPVAAPKPAVVPPAPVVAPAPPAEPEVSTAAILDEPPKETEKPLSELFSAAPTPKRPPDELVKMLEKPEHSAPKKDSKPAVKLAKAEPKPKARTKAEPVRVAHKDKAKTAVAAAPKKKPAPAAQPAPVDSDVALLAALVAHGKAHPEPRLSKAAAKLKQCATLGSVSEADKCRERLCGSSAKGEAECKGQRVIKVASES